MRWGMAAPLRPKTVLARNLRRNGTDVERVLWYALRESIISVRFRRQHPLGNYVADFACPARKLIIELDGSQHIEQAAADAMRSAALAKRGYRVIRFWNNEVLENLDGVLEVIQREVEKPPPHPNPLRPKGQRGSSLKP